MNGLTIALICIALALALYLILDAMTHELIHLKYDYETKMWEFWFVYPMIKRIKVEFYKYQPCALECDVMTFQIANKQCIKVYEFIKNVGSDKVVFWTKF